MEKVEQADQKQAKAAGSSDRASKTSAWIIGHPVRVRILEVVNEVDMSPSEFGRLGMPDMPEFDGKKLSYYANHFIDLEEAGLINVVKKTYGRNNCAEKTYRGVARAVFTEEEWAEFSPETRHALSKAVSTGFMARLDRALSAETIDSRLDRNLYWLAKDVDERGWTEVGKIIEATCLEVEKVCDDAKARLEEAGEEGIPLTAGLFSFESPTPDWEDPEHA